MHRLRDSYLDCPVSHSRQRALLTDLKILHFEDALQRQQRSLEKLRADAERPPQDTPFSRKSRDVVESNEMGVSVARREPRAYVPLSRQEPQLTGEQRKQWEYLQSADYQRYLEEIMSGTGNEAELVQKIKLLRSNSIYLTRPADDQPHRRPSYPHPHDYLSNFSRIDEQEEYEQAWTLNCKPYLEKSSFLEPEQQQQQVSQWDWRGQFNQDARPQNIRIEEEECPETPHYRPRIEDNVKTVTRAKSPLLPSVKANLVSNERREREKKECIERQLTRYDQENRHRAQVTPPKQTPSRNRDKTTERPEKCRGVVAESSSVEESREFYKKDRMEVSAASLYNIDFKLDRPEERSFARCTSAITLSAEKSISRSKSSSKIKMSLVTPSRPR